MSQEQKTFVPGQSRQLKNEKQTIDSIENEFEQDVVVARLHLYLLASTLFPVVSNHTGSASLRDVSIGIMASGRQCEGSREASGGALQPRGGGR
jgi:hypothetical protein